ncbi:DNA internalization-related competence protein ComEC/Rec2 [Luteimonas sp. 3794]|uniref:DNA internalization-related competence protein ComEC/Rec2 n=1 Tax=Luteimonas sp. 3794 TaxID=2817730 RepID=UPI00285DD08F|nr:DNA internalization-related competence protein ComEC/Rec2 [Luteimonas sp. 3794]MDR6992509.1 competence protein ComEC [Luteimonas sp. 3794]
MSRMLFPALGLGVAAALVLGAIACLQVPALPPWWGMALVLAVAVTAWAAGRGRALAAFCVGAALCGLHAAHALSIQLPASMERGDFAVRGQIVGLPVHEPQRTAFLFRVAGDDSVPAPLRGRLLRLSWYDDRREGPDLRRYGLHAGSQWAFTARLRAPRGLRNPGWFDGEKRAMAQRVTAVGYVRSAEPVTRLDAGRGVDRWRERVATRIDGVVDRDSARYVRALAIGDTRALSDLDWEALRATGLTHLIAISGFHVGMVGGFFAWGATAVWWCLPWLGRWLPRPQAAAIIALLASTVYAAVAGWELPTLRTVLMIGVVVIARLARRHLRIADSLAYAAIAVVLVDPMSVLSAGFWLSFAGVAWLVWCLPDARELSKLRGLLASQWVATIGLLPLTVILFGQASLAGPIANLVAIPWWSLVVVPLALIGTGLEAIHTGAGDWAWRSAAWAFELSWPLFDWLAASPISLWWLPEPHWFALPLALLAAFWMLLPGGVPGRWLAALLWLPLLWPDRRLPQHGEAELVVLDVGQGLSVLIRTAHHALLYDAGPAIPEAFDAGERVVVPALQALGVRHLDAIVISHGDADHAGGFGAVQRRFAAPVVFAPQWDRVPGASPCVMGSAWEMDGVTFRFLHPDLYFPAFRNPSSCVLRVETAHGAALLPGDIDDLVERMLVRRDAASLAADVVIAAHHGSRSSSDPAFVQASGAAVAMMSAGHGNRFGHPHGEVVRRWTHVGAAVGSTAGGGATRLRLQAGGLVVTQERVRRPRLWDAAQQAERREAQPGAAGQAGLSYSPD